MSKYTIKLNVVMAGVDTVVIEDPNDYSIGHPITITPTSEMTISDQNGNSVGLTPGVSITGTIIEKK